MRRQHTGRRRNEQARQAILAATLELLATGDTPKASMDAIAARAGVGKQTIYRWWPSKAAVLVEAMTERARVEVPAPDTGSLERDLEAFLIGMFRAARDPTVARVLRTLMAEAQLDEDAASVLQAYTAERRQVLFAVFRRGQARGTLAAAADIDLLIDQAFGVVWYRLLVPHAPLPSSDAANLA